MTGDVATLAPLGESLVTLQFRSTHVTGDLSTFSSMANLRKVLALDCYGIHCNVQALARCDLNELNLFVSTSGMSRDCPACTFLELTGWPLVTASGCTFRDGMDHGC